jgi:hypothetical protein
MPPIARFTVRCLASTTENHTPAFTQAPTTAPMPKAESPRTKISPVAPTARATAIASRSLETAPRPDPALPARSRIPASTGAPSVVLNVVASGDRPRRSS